MNTQPLTDAQLFYLSENLSPDLVATRQQGRTTLSYMEAWQIKATLIRLFGYAGFSSECVDRKMLRAVEQPKSSGTGTNWKVTYEATVTLTIHQTGAVYTESAIADGQLPDYTEAADAALKSAESDALKRCAIFLGTQFGLSLYNNGGILDVIGPVWAPDQIGGRDRYLAQFQQPAQMPPAVADAVAQVREHQAAMTTGDPNGQYPSTSVRNDQAVQDPYMARVAAGLKVDSRDGADA